MSVREPLITPLLDATAPQTEGWERIGGTCSAGIRSMWIRITNVQEPRALPGGVWYQIDSPENVERIELRSGRMGCDNYAVIERTDPLFEDLLGVLLDARYAVQT